MREPTDRQRIRSFGLPILALIVLMVLSCFLRLWVQPHRFALFYLVEILVAGPVAYAIGARIRSGRSAGWTLASLVTRSIAIIVIFANVYRASGMDMNNGTHRTSFADGLYFSS